MKFDINKHIIFTLIEHKPKTDVYKVENIFESCLIGVISWDNGWRHYVFIPENNSKFSDRCMIKIGEYVKQLNLEHSKKLGLTYEENQAKRIYLSEKEVLTLSLTSPSECSICDKIFKQIKNDNGNYYLSLEWIKSESLVEHLEQIILRKVE